MTLPNQCLCTFAYDQTQLVECQWHKKQREAAIAAAYEDAANISDDAPDDYGFTGDNRRDGLRTAKAIAFALRAKAKEITNT